MIRTDHLVSEEVRQMYFHGWNAYMRVGYPADEIKPLSCQPRYRDLGPSRGDLDDVLGKYVFFLLHKVHEVYLSWLVNRFALTLIDGADTLAIMGEWDEFRNAIALIRNVSFDNDVVVSVFGTFRI